MSIAATAASPAFLWGAPSPLSKSKDTTAGSFSREQLVNAHEIANSISMAQQHILDYRKRYFSETRASLSHNAVAMMAIAASNSKQQQPSSPFILRRCASEDSPPPKEKRRPLSTQQHAERLSERRGSCPACSRAVAADATTPFPVSGATRNRASPPDPNSPDSQATPDPPETSSSSTPDDRSKFLSTLGEGESTKPEKSLCSSGSHVSTATTFSKSKGTAVSKNISWATKSVQTDSPESMKKLQKRASHSTSRMSESLSRRFSHIPTVTVAGPSASDDKSIEQTPPHSSSGGGCCRRIWGLGSWPWDQFTTILWMCLKYKASNEPEGRWNYDCSVIPREPLCLWKQRLLQISELPFLILWVYFTYWIVIVSLTASHSPGSVWLSAVVAGVLVGIGLNANAYKSITVPRRRGAVRHYGHARALLKLQLCGESIDTMEMRLDWGMMIRFLLIPFGVSSLSGLTNSNREAFLLVFPKDYTHLAIALTCPAAVVVCVAVMRIFLLWKLKVRWSTQVLFLNGALVD